MNLKKEFVKYSKEIVYAMYAAIVYDCKEYDAITREKMLDAIVEEYKQEHFLYGICTEKELLFLKNLENHQFTKEDLNTYAWEIAALNEKGIFSLLTLEVFEEQVENVKDALSFYEAHKKEKMPMDKLITFMVSIVKIQGKLPTKLFLSMISGITHIEEKEIDACMGNPLFHFYCDFLNEYHESLNSNQEVIYYRKYFDILDDLEEARKRYGIAGNIEFQLEDYFDSFYYGFPIRKPAVKKMVEMLKEKNTYNFLVQTIDEARVLNERRSLEFVIEEPLLSIVNAALDVIPCAAMNGFTPKDYEKELKKKAELSVKFSMVPQNNAHLSKNAADLYYKLYFGLLEFTNSTYNINKEIRKIYKQEGLDVYQLNPIDDYLWEHKEVIDVFIEKNPFHFSKEELEIVKGFKTAISSKTFAVVGFLREYTQILGINTGKLYMVKGIRVDLDKVLPPNDLPKVIKTTLLMFQGVLIFNGFLAPAEIMLGNDFREIILKEYQTAMKYYHL